MKILTLNTHSLHSSESIQSCHILCEEIEKERPDVIALQEVNQFFDREQVSMAGGYIPVGEIPIKESNFALSMQKVLTAMNLNYQFSWLGMKMGYGKFDEGLAMFSLYPIRSAKSLLLSNTSDYNNFKKRMALLVETEVGVFINCHLGWEDDVEEPFGDQLRRINACYNFKKQMYLMGDFNVSQNSEGYKKITELGWRDTYILAKERKGEATISGGIDGWEGNTKELRIDYIFSNRDIEVKASEVVFDGGKTPQISDHFAVMVSV